VEGGERRGEPASGLGQELNLTAQAASPGEADVRGQEDGAESFGQRYVGRLVGSHARSQVPYPLEQRKVGGSNQRKIGQVVDSLLGATPVDPARAERAVKDGRDFEIYQLRRGQVVAAQALASPVTIATVVDQRRCQDRRVDDDQRAWRADRRTSTALEKVIEPPARAPARPSTWSSVGRLACSVSRARRYSWRDWPAAADRRRSSAWTASGTFLTWMVAIGWRYFSAAAFRVAPVF
jgi:hypothetical protein